MFFPVYQLCLLVSLFLNSVFPEYSPILLCNLGMILHARGRLSVALRVMEKVRPHPFLLFFEKHSSLSAGSLSPENTVSNNIF